MSDALLQLSGIVKTFHQGEAVLDILRGAGMTLERGQMVALIGPSGSGKSTALHIAGLMERPTKGQVIITGRDATRLGDGARTALRRKTVGFVYQYHHLLPEFSAMENVAMPMVIARCSRKKALVRAAALLERVGLEHRLTHRPARLSGGEQQRVAIARALANDPALLLADEPTGNLDENTAGEVFALLTELARERGLSGVIATHNPALAAALDRRLELHEGLIREIG
ncbi:MAG: ABC transporter ATP-binding protein [Pseudomonadota bacterium]|nr:ABC transporter ATP-binding protein [Pseudomonadota bacterium]